MGNLSVSHIQMVIPKSKAIQIEYNNVHDTYPPFDTADSYTLLSGQTPNSAGLPLESRLESLYTSAVSASASYLSCRTTCHAGLGMMAYLRVLHELGDLAALDAPDVQLSFRRGEDLNVRVSYQHAMPCFVHQGVERLLCRSHI